MILLTVSNLGGFRAATGLTKDGGVACAQMGGVTGLIFLRQVIRWPDYDSAAGTRCSKRAKGDFKIFSERTALIVPLSRRVVRY